MKARSDDARPRTVTYQGIPGAFSFDACGQAEPDLYAVPCSSFEGALAAVRDARAERAVIPIENSTFGRVADIHRLLPSSELHIVGEHFMPIRHPLLACPGASLSDIRVAAIHPVALGQCRLFLLEHDIEAVPVFDTAAAAAGIAREGDMSKAAIASDSAGVNTSPGHESFSDAQGIGAVKIAPHRLPDSVPSITRPVRKGTGRNDTPSGYSMLYRNQATAPKKGGVNWTSTLGVL